MKQLTIDDLEKLSLGSSILGSGGGGDPSYAVLMAKYFMEEYGPINIITIDELQEEDFVVPLSMMGAPLINMERLPSGREIEILLNCIKSKIRKNPTVLMAAEIGGANVFTPFLIAAKWGLPILDADMIGRAFPELHMSSCYLKNLAAIPAVVVDCLGNSVLIETADAKKLEKMARSITVTMGSSSAVGFYLMKGSEVEGAVIPGTISQALNLGNTIIHARKNKFDPVFEVMKTSGGEILGRGTLIDVNQVVKDGFLEGSATILCEVGKIHIFYQNEYLLAKNGADVIASTPDLIVLMEENSGTPLLSEALRYGLQVAVIVIEAPAIWQTEAGLQLVGPRAFGFGTDYQVPSSISKEGSFYE